MSEPSFEIGIEEEYQLVDLESRQLTSYITHILEDGEMVLRDQLKPELHQSIVEVGTEVCRDIGEAREELIRLRRTVIELAESNGLRIVAAGTHPFTSWETQEITPMERYLGLKKDLRLLADRLLIFGTHVHIGIRDREFRIAALNGCRYFLPHLLCLSTSSPFWRGRDTGLKSYRTMAFRSFPRTGLPPVLRSWDDYEGQIQELIETNCVPDGTKIWWDARPNWNYPTLEIRISDVCTRIEETLCVAALVQALVYRLWELYRRGLSLRSYPDLLLQENKWRAARYGLDHRLVDFNHGREVQADEAIGELVEGFLGDAPDELGSRDEVDYADRILEEGTSADRQLAVYEETGDLDAVVDRLVEETAEGVTT
ncbi:MAG: carboxylate-amine ligase [Thermoanaerobaculia bacterium]|nr:carboxylate-amine ligase [Thermoanaerobaculia bacterium]